MNLYFDTVIIGGGAAGFFTALSSREAHPQNTVLILEKNQSLLSKVKVSGGGRCNVTHACFEPQTLIQNYPRGGKELLGPFYRFQPKDTIKWFKQRGVDLKAESDGRMFPTTNSSQTIIDCFLEEARSLKIEIKTKQKIESIEKKENLFILKLREGIEISARKVVLATGSSPQGHLWAKQLGHTIKEPVPSLFTFNCPSSPLLPLSGISIPSVEVKIKNSPYLQKGPLLMTHFGFSGPCILKLSAWAARFLHSKEYNFEIAVHWLADLSKDEVFCKLKTLKESFPSKALASQNLFNLPKSFWKLALNRSSISENARLNDLTLKDLQNLSHLLTLDTFKIRGKTTHKEEFVTCGGISLKEVHFKTLESKVCPGLFFAGEILDIDGVTGGFNFQSAWTTGFIASSKGAHEIT